VNKGLIDRVDTERIHYDKEFEKIKLEDGDMFVDDQWLVDYHRYHAFALRELGDIKGKKVLNIGAGGLGGGKNTSWLAKQGAFVSGIDITEVGLSIAKQIANFNVVTVDLRLESAENMSFPSEYFDLILSYGVIHHLNIETAIRELFRHLKKGGKLIVVEPWNGNPFFRFARNHLWYPQKNRTKFERALNKEDLKVFLRYFAEHKIVFFELVASFTRVFRLIPIKFIREIIINTCNKIDDFILKAFPFMKNYCRNFVGIFKKI